ncbi:MULTISPECIES: HEPN domain-containing protein [Myxococcaceae]|uniref:HEPN domain-containing protein n=1 Tax=Myxococcaceae TaxID=31 RepID=UPI00129C1358|nr:HEPN domain-containing protein [Simulacricoccus sp. 17bor-14]
MTPEQLRLNVALEVERGDQALSAAEALVQAQLPYDAASRAYYAAFHFARALCLAAGEAPVSHRGVAHLLSLLYVRTAVLPPDTSRLYAGLQRYRESADYDAAFVLDAAGTAQALDDAKVLVERCRTWLRSQALVD